MAASAFAVIATIFAVHASTGSVELSDFPAETPFRPEVNIETTDTPDTPDTADTLDTVLAAGTDKTTVTVETEAVPSSVNKSSDTNKDSDHDDLSLVHKDSESKASSDKSDSDEKRNKTSEKNSENDSTDTEKESLKTTDSDAKKKTSSTKSSDNDLKASDDNLEEDINSAKEKSSDSKETDSEKRSVKSTASSDSETKRESSASTDTNEKSSDSVKSDNENRSKESLDNDKKSENNKGKTKSQTKYPPKTYQIKIEHFNQDAEMPTGCEIVSARMILNYYGKKNISYKEMLSKIPHTNLLVSKDGRIYGQTPFQAFIGDPKKNSGFGCYPPVIEEMMKNYDYEDLYTENISGLPLDFISKTYVTQDIPVLVWATIGMGNSSLTDSWYIAGSSGNITNQKYTWRANEHCLVLIGYDEQSYYFCDPLSYSDVVKYDKTLVEKRYKEIGSYSLLIRKKND